MQKRILLSCIVFALFPALSSATIRPVVSVSLGSDRTNLGMTKVISMAAPNQNSYVSFNNHYDTEAVAGLFVGGETLFFQNWSLQLGLSYFQNSSFAARGNVNQFADPTYNNFTYQYQIQSRRFSVETKLSRVFLQKWHPYISASVGEALNKAYAYTEYPLSSEDVPMTELFNSHTTKAFTYTAGLGVDVDIAEHLRVGAGYRFVGLGNASLGASPLQDGTNTISHTQLHANELIAQITYLG